MRRPRIRRPDEPLWSVAVVLVGGAGVAAGLLGLIVHQLAVGWQPWIILAAFARYLMVLAVPGGILLALRRRRAGAIGGVVVVVLAVVSQLPLYVSSAHKASGSGLTLMQANLRVGSADPRSLVRTADARDVGLLATEELTISERGRLIAAGLTTRFPYRLDAALPTGGGGLAIWSRYPLTDTHNYAGYELGVLSAQIDRPDAAPATVVVVHLLPPYPHPSKQWQGEIARLRGLLARARAAGPVIVAGDFNATTDNAQFRSLLSHGYSDGAEQVGAGYLSTYPTDRWFPPVIAIDHVLTAGRAAVTSLSTVALPGSDHRGLLAHVVLAS
jgi:endonuclease/exonuclease/phosphatase (EEP) superfamily protein YafD